MKAIEFDSVATVRIIFNAFRQRPAERLFAEARRRDVGIIARVPLASGLLTGKMGAASRFEADDHRTFNRDGATFGRGGTFSGVDFERGLKAVDELRPLVPDGATMAQFALRWILSHEAIGCAMPGANNPGQVTANAAASDLAPLSRRGAARRARRLRATGQARRAPPVVNGYEPTMMPPFGCRV